MNDAFEAGRFGVDVRRRLGAVGLHAPDGARHPALLARGRARACGPAAASSRPSSARATTCRAPVTHQPGGIVTLPATSDPYPLPLPRPRGARARTCPGAPRDLGGWAHPARSRWRASSATSRAEPRASARVLAAGPAAAGSRRCSSPSSCGRRRARCGATRSCTRTWPAAWSARRGRARSTSCGRRPTAVPGRPVVAGRRRRLPRAARSSRSRCSRGARSSWRDLGCGPSRDRPGPATWPRRCSCSTPGRGLRAVPLARGPAPRPVRCASSGSWWPAADRAPFLALAGVVLGLRAAHEEPARALPAGPAAARSRWEAGRRGPPARGDRGVGVRRLVLPVTRGATPRSRAPRDRGQLALQRLGGPQRPLAQGPRGRDRGPRVPALPAERRHVRPARGAPARREDPRARARAGPRRASLRRAARTAVLPALRPGSFFTDQLPGGAIAARASATAASRRRPRPRSVRTERRSGRRAWSARASASRRCRAERARVRRHAAGVRRVQPRALLRAAREDALPRAVPARARPPGRGGHRRARRQGRASRAAAAAARGRCLAVLALVLAFL